ncbi:MAG: VOC family protein [Acidimicrobiia bacterium]
MGNKIVHWELMGPDGEALTGFYGDLFGWKATAVPGFDGYHLVEAEDADIGGAVGKGPEEAPSYLTIYIEVDSIDDHLAKVADAGGKTIMPRTVIPGTVTFAMFADPAGNHVGLVEAATPPAE